MNAEPAVLVVDDELAIRRFLRLSLETNDYRIYEAENGHEAWQRRHSSVPKSLFST